jgi:hypothetical protein
MEKLFVGLLFIALGAFAVIVSIFSLVRTRRFVAEAAPAYGEVIALRECPGRHRRPTYAPVIRFAPLGSRPVEFTDATSANPPGFRVGDRVNVLYRRNDPTDARVTSPFKLYLHEVVFVAGGALFMLIGSVLVFFLLFG